HTDALFGCAAHRAMASGQIGRVSALDRELLATKLARELREASTSTGRAFLTEASILLANPLLDAFRARVEADESPGNHAIAFHAASAAAGVPEIASMIAWGYQTIA